ncbi:MAG TPA: glycosyltransferase family 4 protein [Methylomirabilota bacterium]|nr:glycosyltransferase family 4 protein [Methylomirabilota bacterium]
MGGAATYFGGLLPVAARHLEIESIHVITERGVGAPSGEMNGRLSIERALPTRIGAPRRTRLEHAASYIGTQLWLAAHLPDRVRSTGADLVHVHTRFRGRMFFWALRRCGVPIVADLRDRRTDLAPWLQVADRLVCVIESVRLEAIAAGFPEGRTAVVRTPLIIPPSLLADPLGAARVAAERHGLGSAPYVLSVGDIAPHKGIPELVAGFGRFRAAHPEARLVVAGVNHGGTSMAAALDAAPGVMRLGPVPREEALALMAGAAVVIRPSHPSEGLPRVIHEAVAMGAKVVAPPGIPELDAAMPESVLDAVTPEAIERALEAAWRRTGPPALDLSAHAPERVAEALVKVYRSTVGGVVW